MTKIVSQLVEDIYHTELRLKRIKTNANFASAIAMRLFAMLLNDEHGISRDCYEQLLCLIEVLPVTDSAKRELLRQVDAVDDRFFIPMEDNAESSPSKA